MGNCQWWCCDKLSQSYHDLEWGRPIHNDQLHFEALSLELLQSGLNWALVLKKRPVFRDCFADFDFQKVSAFGENDIERILSAPGMIRSRRKILAIIGNARCFLQIIKDYGSFDRYIWSFTEGHTLVYSDHRPVSSSELSDTICKDLKAKGFRFLGSVTVYSYLQACGIINDHSPDCPVYRELISAGKTRYIK